MRYTDYLKTLINKSVNFEIFGAKKRIGKLRTTHKVKVDFSYINVYSRSIEVEIKFKDYDGESHSVKKLFYVGNGVSPNKYLMDIISFGKKFLFIVYKEKYTIEQVEKMHEEVLKNLKKNLNIEDLKITEYGK